MSIKIELVCSSCHGKEGLVIETKAVIIGGNNSIRVLCANCHTAKMDEIRRNSERNMSAELKRMIARQKREKEREKKKKQKEDGDKK